MKKFIALQLILAMVLSFAACTKKEETPAENTPPANETPAEGMYKDGTYVVTYDHYDGKGWVPTVTVEIKDGKIASGKMDYINMGDGHLKSADADYSTRMKDKSGTAPAEAYEKLDKQLVETQDITKVDLVAGATHSAEFFHEMVAKALENAKAGTTDKTYLVMNDTYSASEADFDERGYKASIAITFENDKITKVVYNEADKDGNTKRDNADSNTNMEAKSGISSKAATEKLEAALIEKQGVDGVDSVTGATSSSSKFLELAKQALAKRAEYK